MQSRLVHQFAPVAAMMVFGVAASAASAAITQIVEILPTASAHNRFYNEFTNIPPISSTDPAQGHVPVALQGGAQFATTNAGLTNGPDQVNGGSDAGITTGGGFATEGQHNARMRIDLVRQVPVNMINLYTWHAGTRLDQVVDIYAATGNEGGFNVSPAGVESPSPGTGDAATLAAGWTYITSVDTRIIGGTNGFSNNSNGQIGVSVLGNIGTYRFFLFDIFASNIDDGGGSSGYFGEIDIIPEPASLGLLAAGGALLLRRRRV